MLLFYAPKGRGRRVQGPVSWNPWKFFGPEIKYWNSLSRLFLHSTKVPTQGLGWQKKNCKLLFYPRSTQEFIWTRLNVSVRSRSNWNLEVLVFEERGKPEYPEKKPLGARGETNNKLNPHMVSTPGFESGPHWWEASALITSPPLPPLTKSAALQLFKTSNLIGP